MIGKFVLKKTAQGKYVFNLQASNGLNILTSESYSSKAAALNGIESVRKHAVKAANFELRTAKNGKPYFVLLASNKEVIGQSQMYAAMDSARKGIASVQANAPTTRMEDLADRK